MKEVILRKFLKGAPENVKVSEESLPYIYAAMEEYAKRELFLAKKDMKRSRRRLFPMLFGNFTRMTHEELILFFRVRNLKRNKAITQRLADEENRKYYIVRSSTIGFTRFSSQDVDMNKRLRIFSKDATAFKLSKIADAIIIPKNRR